jgi:hypothetical protein
MDNKLYYTKDTTMKMMLFVFSVLTVALSVLGVIYGATPLLCVATVSLLVYALALNNKPIFIVVPVILADTYMIYRMLTVYIKKATTDGFGVLISPTFAAMLVFCLAATLTYNTVWGTIKNKYVSLIFIMAAFWLCWAVFVNSLFASSVRGYTYAIPITLFGLYCALIKDRKTSCAEVYSIMTAFGVILCVISVIKAFSTEEASVVLSIVLAVISVVEMAVLYIYLEGHIKNFFIVGLIVIFCLIVQIMVITISVDIKANSLKYYYMYSSYIGMVVQLALFVLEGNRKAEQKAELKEEVKSEVNELNGETNV